MAAHGRVSLAERASDLRGVPDLSMVMGEHNPQAPQRTRRDGDAEHPDVALEKGANEILPPRDAGCLRFREERARKSAAQPEAPELPLADLADGEPTHVDERHAPGERLGAGMHEIGGGTA